MNPTWATHAAAKASLREVSPRVREAHVIVKYWSTVYSTWRFARVFTPRAAKL